LWVSVHYLLNEEVTETTTTKGLYITSVKVKMSDSEDSSSASEREEKEERVAKKARTEGTKSTLSSAPLEVAPAHSSKSRKHQPIIVLLDQATLETVKNKRGVYELLNCDDHRDLCKKKLHKDPNEFRPDILHQELLALLDSPINKAGMLKIYFQTKKGVLVDVNPSIRIPRTYKRFAGLMVQLLHKMKIKAGTESTTLLKIIKNPFSQYLPAGTQCYGFEPQGTLYSPISMPQALLPSSPDEEGRPPTCFIIGAMSTGNVTIEDHPYIEKMLSISEYPLSGASAITRIMGGIEHHWGIV
jgi:rRNA small subunit pseudouridine methyltransferase Nep1